MSELFGVFGIDWRLLLIQAFNFGILLVALWWFLYRPVLTMIERRRLIIEKGVQDASEAERRLSAADETRRETIAQASIEAEEIVGGAKKRAEEKGNELLSEARDRAQAELSDARARAEELKERALTESEQEIARAAVLAAEKILNTKRAQ